MHIVNKIMQHKW